jgi:hypothetical protein
MSNILVNEGNQPEAGAFAELPTADQLAARGTNPNVVDNIPATPDPTSVDDGIPEKFKGKSAAEIAQSYANLEAELGRKSQEVGSLRGLTDQLLELKRTEDLTNNGGQPTPTEVTADDLLADPRNAIRTVAAEETSQTNSRVDALEAQLALKAFEDRYPTFRQDQTDEKFQDFVQKSNYRSNLAGKAAQGDLAAADELWSAYADVRDAGTSQEENTETVTQQADALESAQAIASRGGSETDVSHEKPISRQVLINKRIEDPDGYYDPAFQAYITEMYQKGLVK